MTYLLCVQHVDAQGRGTACAEPLHISAQELVAIRADVFRWLDGASTRPRTSGLRPNQVIVTDGDHGLLFSAYRA